MFAAYNSMRDAYTRVREAYNDLENAEQKSIKLRYVAFLGCMIASLMCMRVPVIGFPLLLPCICIICDTFSTGFIAYHGFYVLIVAALANSWWYLFADVSLFISMISYAVLIIYTGFHLWRENRSSSGGSGTVRLPL